MQLVIGSNDSFVLARRLRVARVTREENACLETGILLIHVDLTLVKQLGKNAPDAPHVDGLTVVLLEEAALGCPVPAGADMRRQLPCRFLIRCPVGYLLLGGLPPFHICKLLLAKLSLYPRRDRVDSITILDNNTVAFRLLERREIF